MRTNVKRGKKSARSSVQAFTNDVKARGASFNPLSRALATSTDRQLSLAASRYLLAFMDPFHLKARTAYVPQLPTCRTKKVTVYTRGSFSTGTAGVGMLMFSPCTANDQNCIYSSTSTFAGNSFTLPSALNANGVSSARLATPFPRNSMNTTAVNNTIEARIVSFSVRVYYTGSVVNCGGTVYAYSDPDTDNIVAMDYAQVGAKDITEIRPVTVGTSYSTVLIPVRGSQTQFPSATAGTLPQLYPYSDGASVVDPTQLTGATAVGPPCGGFLIVAPSATPLTFNYEVVQHVEYNGQGLPQGDLTPSAADTIGFDHVQSLLVDSLRIAAADPVLDFPAVVKRELGRRGLRMSAIPDY